jgi:hypothetical protein
MTQSLKTVNQSLTSRLQSKEDELVAMAREVAELKAQLEAESRKSGLRQRKKGVSRSVHVYGVGRERKRRSGRGRGDEGERPRVGVVQTATLRASVVRSERWTESQLGGASECH